MKYLGDLSVDEHEILKYLLEEEGVDVA